MRDSVERRQQRVDEEFLCPRPHRQRTACASARSSAAISKRRVMSLLTSFTAASCRDRPASEFPEACLFASRSIAWRASRHACSFASSASRWDLQTRQRSVTQDIQYHADSSTGAVNRPSQFYLAASDATISDRDCRSDASCLLSRPPSLPPPAFCFQTSSSAAATLRSRFLIFGNTVM